MIDHIEVWDAINKGEMRCRKCGHITWLVPWMIARKGRCADEVPKVREGNDSSRFILVVSQLVVQTRGEGRW